jgi:protein TonB
MEKQGLPTVREEFPIDISGVPFTGAVVREQTSDGQKYFRGFYSTSRRGYLLSFDVEGPSETAPNDLVRKLVHFSQPEYLFVCTSSLTSEPCATPPHVVEAPNADIPEAMRKKKLEGKPLLWLIVDVDGRPQDVRVAKSAGRELDEAAVNVVKRWKFSPGRANGKPVPVAINVEANFQPD